jgi:hypothetical protein
MKKLLALSACLLASAMCGGQVVDSSVEGTINRVLKTGAITGWDTKWLSTTGDAGAVVITKELSDAPLSDFDIDAALGVLDFCFYDPRNILGRADREPRTALLLLRYLDCQAHGPDDKRKVADTKKLLLRRVATHRQE